MSTQAEQWTASAVIAELEAFEDPKTRAINERHGDDHGVKLSDLRAIAKRVKSQPELAVELWDTEVTAARLVAILVCRPKQFSAQDLDAMTRQPNASKVQDWLNSYVVKKSPHVEPLRQAWMQDSDPQVCSAGWALTADRVVKDAEGLDLESLLNVIEAEMTQAPDRLQWAMNTCLARIGIEHPVHRQRAIDIGERLGVLKDYPTPPNCTSPYAPAWIAEMVRRGSASPQDS